jgi:hypothetical protein
MGSSWRNGQYAPPSGAQRRWALGDPWGFPKTVKHRGNHEAQSKPTDRRGPRATE